MLSAYFHTGKTDGPYVHQQEEEGYAMDAEDSRAQQVVYRLKWKPTNYHELLMFLVVEMHVATGEHTNTKEYWQNGADGHSQISPGLDIASFENSSAWSRRCMRTHIKRAPKRAQFFKNSDG